jgi:hypothetical protein
MARRFLSLVVLERNPLVKSSSNVNAPMQSQILALMYGVCKTHFAIGQESPLLQGGDAI